MSPSLVLDLVVVATLIFAIVRGWSHRSVREAFSLLGLAIGIGAAVLLVGGVTRVLTFLTSLEINVARVTALVSIVAICSLAGAVVGVRTSRAVIIPGSRLLDSIGGAVMGAMRSILVITLFLFGVVALSSQGAPGFVEIVDDSRAGDVFADPNAPFVVFYESVITRSPDLQALTLWVRQQSPLRETVPSDRLDFQATDARLVGAEDAEKEMLTLINEERAEVGLDALEWCERCAVVARGHSKDMYRNGYFAHVNLEGDDPFERMKEADIGYDSAGENLAIAPTVVEAHEGLMRSRDHRENILRDEFDEVGIGIFEGPYGLMCTQVFRATL